MCWLLSQALWIGSQPEDYAQYEKRHQENIHWTRQQNKKVPLTSVVVVSKGDEPLDLKTDDGASQVEASFDNNIAKAAGFFNQVNRFNNEDPDDYKDPNFHRQVNSLTITQEEFNSLHKQLQILVATVDSLSLDCNNRNKFFACNSSNCVNCKNKNLNNLTFLGDSDAHKCSLLRFQISLHMRRSLTVPKYKQQTRQLSCMLLEKEQFL
jgi:hypothetical protein